MYAGYAFSIWGIIYSFVASFVVWQAWPQRQEWVHLNIGIDFALNALSNCAWLIAFNTKAGKFVVSTIIIFFGIAASLLRLYLRLDIGRSGFGYGSEGKAGTLLLGAQPTRPAWITVSEWLCVHCMVSIYLGWTCVACIANMSIMLTPQGGRADLGWTAAGWSVLMQCIAAALACTALLTRKDVLFAAPVAWALVAIGKQQQDPTYPGGPTASQAGYGIGYTLAGLTAATALYRLWQWKAGKTKFAVTEAGLDSDGGALAGKLAAGEEELMAGGGMVIAS